MGINPHHASRETGTDKSTLGVAACLAALLVLLIMAGTGAAQSWPTLESSTAGTAERVQILHWSISAAGLQVYRITGLRKGQWLYVRAEASGSSLDPLIALLKPDVELDALARAPLGELVPALSLEHDPIDATRRVLARYALFGSDDTEGHYYATLSIEIPEDGEYRLVVGSSIVRPSFGDYRLLVGVNAPNVLLGRTDAIGSPFVFAGTDSGALSSGVVSVSGELTSDPSVRYYNLTDLAAGETFFAFAEALTGDLKPTLTLYDHSDKPVAYRTMPGPTRGRR